MENNTPWYKKGWFIGLVVLVVLVGGWMLMRGDGEDDGAPNNVTEEVPYTDPKGDEISVLGKLDCLPLQSGKVPTGDECIIGLKGSDGKFYALDTSKVEVIEKGIGLDTNVRVVGKFTGADQNSEEAKIYKYEGVLAARVLQNQD
ncbi:hypothetical protein KW796_01790 [Candidatus Parcubacteria bacterium]|nr:hypothetical protein [Candidatus Parcubacteria bacterium]